MIVIFPVFLAIHIIGVVMWLGGSMVQYLFFTDIYKRAPETELPFYTGLIKKVNAVMVHSGLWIVWLSGLIMILAQGMEWLRSHGFVHIKIALGLAAAALTLLAYIQIRKAVWLLSADDNPGDRQAAVLGHLETWKKYIITLLIVMGAAVMVAVYRFFN